MEEVRFLVVDVEEGLGRLALGLAHPFLSWGRWRPWVGSSVVLGWLRGGCVSFPFRRLGGLGLCGPRLRRVCWVGGIVKFLKLNAGGFMHGSGLGVVWGVSLLRAVVAGCPPQSGVSKAQWYGGWEGAFLRLMGEVARRVGV